MPTSVSRFPESDWFLEKAALKNTFNWENIAKFPRMYSQKSFNIMYSVRMHDNIYHEYIKKYRLALVLHLITLSLSIGFSPK